MVDSGRTDVYPANEWNHYTDGANVNDTNNNPAHSTHDGRHKPAAACPEPAERDAEWFAQSAEYNYDFDAAQSGPIGHNQITWMETTVDGPGAITFDYKLSAAAGDAFTFWVDGQMVFSRSGSIDWSECGPFSVSGLGRHTLRWRYAKDGSGTSGSDCAWVDHVRWQPQTLYNSTQLQDGIIGTAPNGTSIRLGSLE